MVWQILSENSELVIECAHAAQAIGLSVEPKITDRWFNDTLHQLTLNNPIAIALVQPPSLEQIVEISYLARSNRLDIVIAVLEGAPNARKTLDVASDLGIIGVSEIPPLVAAIALLDAHALSPWNASVRLLPPGDRARLRPALTQATKGNGQLTREKEGQLAWSIDAKSPRILLGEARDAAVAIAALRAVYSTTSEVISSVEGVDRQAVLDVIFGPPRALSDPASKAALQPYGIATPVEELCSSASRSAAEASRIGFPVRISLASPDLRIWDHPDLVVDAVDNAARVREVFGLLTGLARSRSPESRLLGVTVAVSNEAAALLHVCARPLPRNRVSVEIGFADPHGKASRDSTITVLPSPMATVARAVERLKGCDLILSGSKTQRLENLESLGDTLQRVAAFVNDHANQIVQVELLPVALLVGGGIEVREACVTVGEAFQRSMEG
ncbi:MAG: acetate--CoA ligase family protein [Deltaproteobacteria bacterium]|nr:acetate--CoA ligase family protein [Deltaproteobacteria bacterium]